MTWLFGHPSSPVLGGGLIKEFVNSSARAPRWPTAVRYSFTHCTVPGALPPAVHWLPFQGNENEAHGTESVPWLPTTRCRRWTQTTARSRPALSEAERVAALSSFPHRPVLLFRLRRASGFSTLIEDKVATVPPRLKPWGGNGVRPLRGRVVWGDTP